MTEAQRIAHDLEERRHRLMMRQVVLSDQTLSLAYDVVVHGCAVAKQKLRESRRRGSTALPKRHRCR
jgi:hypothetical protein